MTDSPSPRRRSRASMWYVCGLATVCLVLLLGLVTAGCGGDSSDTEDATATTAAAASETTATTAAAEEMGWLELTDAIVATWSEALQKLNALLEGLPDPSGVMPQVEALKEDYIRQFVELGKVNETLSDSDKASLSSRFWSETYAIEDQDWYKTFADNYNAYLYANADVDFCNLVYSFNILTQYSDYALLKEQQPEEAARLGIE